MVFEIGKVTKKCFSRIDEKFVNIFKKECAMEAVNQRNELIELSENKGIRTNTIFVTLLFGSLGLLFIMLVFGLALSSSMTLMISSFLFPIILIFINGLNRNVRKTERVIKELEQENSKFMLKKNYNAVFIGDKIPHKNSSENVFEIQLIDSDERLLVEMFFEGDELKIGSAAKPKAFIDLK